MQCLTFGRSLRIKRTSITLDDRIYATGLQIATKRGFKQSFSAYVAWLIQRDAEGAVTREDAPLEKPQSPRGQQKAKTRKGTQPAS